MLKVLPTILHLVFLVNRKKYEAVIYLLICTSNTYLSNQSVNTRQGSAQDYVISFDKSTYLLRYSQLKPRLNSLSQVQNIPLTCSRFFAMPAKYSQPLQLLILALMVSKSRINRITVLCWLVCGYSDWRLRIQIGTNHIL